jgi:glutathione S-transferase
MTEKAQEPGVIYPEEYELVASKNSYYSARVRACLQYKRLPYVETPANITAIRRVINLTGERVYPIVVCPDGTVLRDGCDIVEALEQRHPERPVIPEDPVLHPDGR